MKLGLVTYNIAADWDLETLIDTCAKLGYEGVELRTTHAHGVETSLSPKERARVRRRFEDSPVALVGLGSTFEYHSPDPDELKRNIEGTKECVLLARDVGADGVKVRPNAFPEGVPQEKTIEQIGDALREVGEHAAEHGVRIRLEVHGRGTAHPPSISKMLDRADRANVFACWNSNDLDMDETGSIDASFDLLRGRIDLVHITELWSGYPWARLFGLLQQSGYEGYCLAEIQATSDAERLLRYYRRLFQLTAEKGRSESM